MSKDNIVLNFINDLENRGLIHDCTNKEKLLENLKNNKAIYLGVDPTAISLHLGNYLSLSFLKRFLKKGFKVFLVLGNLTAQIGDPSFKTKERPILLPEDLKKNIENIKKQIKNLCPNIEIFENLDFYKEFTVIEILKDIGVYMNVSSLLSKDFLKDRLQTGLTVTEFLYPLFQSYDFYYLNKFKNVFIQAGGSDQWGNITSGIELIRKKTDEENKSVGITFPLLIDNNGKKFGKSEGNAYFLDKNLTSPYEIYQYLINLSDDLVIKYLKFLTFLEISEIDEIEKKHKENYTKKIAQKTLAYEIVKDIHSSEISKICEEISEKLFKNEMNFENKHFDLMKNTIPTIKNPSDFNIVSILQNLGFCNSKSEAKRLLNDSGINLFDKKIKDPFYKIEKLDFKNNFLLIKKGKKDFGLIFFEELNNY